MADPRKQTEIGEVPESWQVVRLGALLSLSSGTQRPDDLTVVPTEDCPFPVYGGNGVMGYSSRYSVETPTLVIGRVGAYSGCVHITSGKGWITDNALFQRDPLPRTVNLGFLAEALRTINLGSVRRAGAQPLVTQGEILQLSIALPPLDEQVAIATVVELMRERADKERAICRKLTDLRSTTMAKLFREGLRGEPLKESEIGPIPESWEVITLRERCQLKSGGTPSRACPEYWNGDVPWVKTTEIDYRDIMTTEEKITQVGLENSSAKIFDAGTLLMAMYGQGVTRGRVAILGLPAATNQACAAFFPDGTLSSRYLYAYFTYAYDHIRQIGHGANQQNLSLELLQGIKIPVPKAVTEQEEIFSVISKVQKRTEAAERKRDTLRDLFRATLGTLMTGKVRVSGIETPAEVANA